MVILSGDAAWAVAHFHSHSGARAERVDVVELTRAHEGAKLMETLSGKVSICTYEEQLQGEAPA